MKDSSPKRGNPRHTSGVTRYAIAVSAAFLAATYAVPTLTELDVPKGTSAGPVIGRPTPNTPVTGFARFCQNHPHKAICRHYAA